MENFIYTLVQLVHNFGAVALAGSPVVALWFGRDNKIALHKLTWLWPLGWVAQGASGIGFAVTSYTIKGQLPAVEGVAMT